jgi:hypothetical protein
MILTDRLLHVFHWPSGYPIRLALPAMMILSVILHVVAMYAVRSPSTGRSDLLPPPPAKITFIPADPSGAESVLLGASDPSWLQPGRYRDQLLPPPRPGRPLRALRPELPPLVPAPPTAVPEVWVPALPPLAVRPWLEDRAQPPSVEMAPVSARLEPAGPAVTEDLLARLRAVAPPQPPGLPVELLVAFNANGEARHVWVLRSCGVPALDLAAQRAVQRSRFGPTGADYQGTLRIVWGPGEVAP